MSRITRSLSLLVSHGLVLLAGFALGIYLLPILTEPVGPSQEAVESAADTAQFTGQFRRDLEDSDALHYGEGVIYVSPRVIAFQGRISPGPDFRLYLSPEFVETEEGFKARKHTMIEVGLVRSFDRFMLDVPASIDVGDFTTAIVWCESFGQFITAAEYQ